MFNYLIIIISYINVLSFSLLKNLAVRLNTEYFNFLKHIIISCKSNYLLTKLF